MEKVLTKERVESIFMDCIFKSGESVGSYVPAQGIHSSVGFHPRRIIEYQNEIIEMLDELPDKFREIEGAPFKDAYYDKNGKQWTCIGTMMEQLFQLGLAIGKVSFQNSREVWPLLPGGLPRYRILDELILVEHQVV
ncbi:MAG: hypothetical protein KAJ58_01715 [Candidatus Pacebacteria bacterium]|nr:hypothetical protein [Candidatus Paceibacterota bacterium]